MRAEAAILTVRMGIRSSVIELRVVADLASGEILLPALQTIGHTIYRYILGLEFPAAGRDQVIISSSFLCGTSLFSTFLPLGTSLRTFWRVRPFVVFVQALNVGKLAMANDAGNFETGKRL